MIQCKDCEHFHRSESGQISFSCDPFTNIKEPECLAKWQLLKMNQLVAGHQATLEYYGKFAPLQEKMFKIVEREIQDMDESEKWRVEEEEEDEEQDKGEDEPQWDLGEPSY